MALIKGTTILLYDREYIGKDAFEAPLYSETPVKVDDILICPASTDEVTDTLQLYGKRVEYTLCIPKENTNVWEDRTVEFYGHKWRTFGAVLEWHAPMTPGTWNRRVRVERYG